jgi:hypothetical protein
MEAREWEASARDALYPSAPPRGLHMHSSRLLGGGTAQGAAYSHVGNAVSSSAKVASFTSMREFRAMLSAGSELKLRSDTEGQLKSALSTVKRLYRDMERVLDDSTGGFGQGQGTAGNTAATATGHSKVTHSTSDPQTHSIARSKGAVSSSSLLHTQSPAKKGLSGSSSAALSSQVDDDEDEEDDDDTKCRRGLKGSKKGKPSINALSDLLLSLDRLPPGVLAARDQQYPSDPSPAAALRELYFSSVELKERAEAVFDRAAVARSLKPK